MNANLKDSYKYRILKEFEIVQAGDEVDISLLNENARWVPATCIGTPVPSPLYPAHRIYRRLKGIPRIGGKEL